MDQYVYLGDGTLSGDVFVKPRGMTKLPLTVDYECILDSLTAPASISRDCVNNAVPILFNYISGIKASMHIMFIPFVWPEDIVFDIYRG